MFWNVYTLIHYKAICKYFRLTINSDVLWHPSPISQDEFKVWIYKISSWWQKITCRQTQIAMSMGPTWGPPGSCQPQMGPILAPWPLLSGEAGRHRMGYFFVCHPCFTQLTFPVVAVALFRNITPVLTLIPAWISNYMLSKVWDEITYPFLKINGATVEV